MAKKPNIFKAFNDLPKARSLNNALMVGIIEGDLDKVKTAVQNGADINFVYPIGDALTGNDKTTPLIEASWRTLNQGGAVFDYLLSFDNINVNASDASGYTALNKVVGAGGNIERVRKLLDKGADPLIKDSEGECPITIAMDMENFELADILTQAIEKQVEKEIRNLSGFDKKKKYKF